MEPFVGPTEEYPTHVYFKSIVLDVPAWIFEHFA